MQKIEKIGEKFKKEIRNISVSPLKIRGFRYCKNTKTFYVLVREWGQTEEGEEAEYRLMNIVDKFNKEYKDTEFNFEGAMDVSGKSVIYI